MADTPRCGVVVVVEDLPPEVLAHVFAFLDGPAPSDQHLHDQPSADMLRRPHDPRLLFLKTASLVNKRWRAVVLPRLFRHVVWYLHRLDLALAEQHKTEPSAIPVLPFLRAHGLAAYVKSFTLVINPTPSPRLRPASSGSGSGSSHGHSHGEESSSSSRHVGLYRRGDGSGQYGYLPAPLSPTPFGLGGGLRRSRPWEVAAEGAAARNLTFNEDTNWLWEMIFETVDPTRFTIVAAPSMLASLLARMLYLGDAWSFDQSHHVLSLSREDGSSPRLPPPQQQQQQQQQAQETGEASSFTRRPAIPRVPCALFTAFRPWTALLLNEGSSTRVYKTYHYHLKRPPSVLGALLGIEEFPNDCPLLPPSITSLSYVGIFPLASHIADTLVAHLPPLKRLYVQLVPRNDLLQDRKEMEHLDMNDLWGEKDTAYDQMIPKLFGRAAVLPPHVDTWPPPHAVGEDPRGHWKNLEVFETGDVVDTRTWRHARELFGGTSGEFRIECEGYRLVRTRFD